MKQLAQVLEIDGYTVNGPEGFLFGGNRIGTIIGQSIAFVFAFAGIGLLLMIISSGFSMMTAAGDAKKLEGSKARLTNAVIGFLLIFASFWIVQLTGRILGWDTLNYF